MTGEMPYIDPETGIDSTGEEWPIHLAIAKAVGGRLRPFDQYQGPYIVVGEDVRVGTPPYQLAPQGLGVVRLWLDSDDGAVGYVYREDTETKSEPFLLHDDFTENNATWAAQQLLRGNE
jgi:hypothetical protein